jgi:hypothetical protein
MDYRLYHVEPPKPTEGRYKWTGSPLLRGMPDVEAGSERDLRERIDDAYARLRE